MQKEASFTSGAINQKASVGIWLTSINVFRINSAEGDNFFIDDLDNLYHSERNI
jgi:hypothetical protein